MKKYLLNSSLITFASLVGLLALVTNMENYDSVAGSFLWATSVISYVAISSLSANSLTLAM